LVDTTQDRLDAARAALGEGAATHCSTLDSPQSCAAAFAAAGGPVDALIHLAGLFEPDPLDPAIHDIWDRAMAANLTNAYDMCLAFKAQYRSGQHARIVLVSSLAYRRGSAPHTAYSTAKAGLIGLTRSLSRAYAPDILVNAVAPGLIETRMTERLIARDGPQRLTEIPLKRFGKPEEIAPVITFLCGPGASYITGQCITADGGITNN
jgi:3-oxoacyl-[acyl-carrier protein] reductase